MKRLMIGMVVLGCFGAGCGTSDSDACSSDGDCKGDRICESGECVSPDDGGNNTSTNNTSQNNTSQNNTSTNSTPGNNTTDEGALGSECFSALDCDSEYCRDGVCSVNDFGDTCQGLDECEYGACLVSSDGTDDFGYCSATCESFADCPAFWDCAELSNAAGTYCQQD